MNKKPKFNLMDCLIILVVIAAVAGGLYVLKNLKGGGNENSKSVTVKYTVEFAKEDEEIAKLFAEAAKRGDKCFVGEKERGQAIIKDVTYSPAELLTVNTETGEANWADVPDKYKIDVTLESEGTESDTEITVGEGAVLKVGDETSVKGKGYAGYGFIIALDTVKK